MIPMGTFEIYTPAWTPWAPSREPYHMISVFAISRVRLRFLEDGCPCGTRTRTPFRAPEPKPGVPTNFTKGQRSPATCWDHGACSGSKHTGECIACEAFFHI